MDSQWTCCELCLILPYTQQTHGNLRTHQLCCVGTQTPRFWGNARLLSRVFGFDDLTMKAIQNLGETLWFFKNKTLRIQGLGSAANVSHVICENWGIFQRKVNGEFMRNSRRISLSTF